MLPIDLEVKEALASKDPSLLSECSDGLLKAIEANSWYGGATGDYAIALLEVAKELGKTNPVKAMSALDCIVKPIANLTLKTHQLRFVQSRSLDTIVHLFKDARTQNPEAAVDMMLRVFDYSSNNLLRTRAGILLLRHYKALARQDRQAAIKSLKEKSVTARLNNYLMDITDPRRPPDTTPDEAKTMVDTAFRIIRTCVSNFRVNTDVGNRALGIIIEHFDGAAEANLPEAVDIAAYLSQNLHRVDERKKWFLEATLIYADELIGLKPYAALDRADFCFANSPEGDGEYLTASLETWGRCLEKIAVDNPEDALNKALHKGNRYQDDKQPGFIQATISAKSIFETLATTNLDLALRIVEQQRRSLIPSAYYDWSPYGQFINSMSAWLTKQKPAPTLPTISAAAEIAVLKRVQHG